jgi:hypothetical protein
MPARTAVHIARCSSDNVMPSPRHDTGDEGMSWRSHTRPESRASGMARGRPPSLAVQHREVDVGHLGPPDRQAVGSSGSISDCRLSICDWRLGRGSPLWLAVQHREVDIGHWPRGAPIPRYLPKVWKDSMRTFGRYEGCERAREAIALLVVRNTSNLPKVHVNAKATMGRCNTGRCRATRSCASDAEHEFSRIRSIGSNPIMSFRRSGFPQLLLMQPSLLGRSEVSDRRTREAFS